jgi:hypothetical protein
VLPEVFDQRASRRLVTAVGLVTRTCIEPTARTGIQATAGTGIQATAGTRVSISRPSAVVVAFVHVASLGHELSPYGDLPGYATGTAVWMQTTGAALLVAEQCRLPRV